MAVTKRTADRCKRLAYDMADLASRLECEGFGNEADAIRSARKDINWVSDSLYKKLSE